MRGEISTGEARAAALAAHAAARAAGRAAHAANYAVRAASLASSALDPTDTAVATATKERDWQYGRLPTHLRQVVFPARDRA